MNQHSGLTYSIHQAGEERNRDRARIENLEKMLGQIKDICAEALDPMSPRLPYTAVNIIFVLAEEALKEDAE